MNCSGVVAQGSVYQKAIDPKSDGIRRAKRINRPLC